MSSILWDSSHLWIYRIDATHTFYLFIYKETMVRGHTRGLCTYVHRNAILHRWIFAPYQHLMHTHPRVHLLKLKLQCQFMGVRSLLYFLLHCICEFPMFVYALVAK